MLARPLGLTGAGTSRVGGRGARSEWLGLLEIGVFHELLLQLRHQHPDTVCIVLAGLLQVDMLLLKVKTLDLLLLRAVFLPLAFQFFEALLHEVDGTARHN